ncbi:MAG: hypothetical protein ACXVGH_03090 [Mycobacteriales bacterium]
MLLLLVHAGATCALAGLVWVVQLVVYPAFLAVGPTPGWPAYHEAHSRRMALVVTVPWAVQGVSLAALLLRGQGPAWLLAALSVCALATVVVTVTVSVPLHQRLGAYDERLARRLLRTNWWRTAAWTVGAVLSLLLVSAA